MGDLISICCDCEELQDSFDGVGGGLIPGAGMLPAAMGAASFVPVDLVLAGLGGAMLMSMFGGNRPRLRHNNQNVRNFTPHPVPPPMGYSQHGRRGVMIGINYYGTRAELKGCINDVQRIAQKLHGTYQLLVLTDDQRDQSLLPTRRNIMHALNWLISGLTPNGKKTIFLHFSGHGSQQEDEDGDEADGLDETICPVDYDRMGMISDDDLKRDFLGKIPPGNRLLSIMDCCHSGTVLDLPYYCVGSGPPERCVMLGDQMSERNKIPCDAIMISGCADAQTSADVNAVGKKFVELADNRAGGALTSAFLVAASQNSNHTLSSLLYAIRHDLSVKGFEQVPQISASFPYDVRATPFDLFPSSYQPPQLAPHYPPQQAFPPQQYPQQQSYPQQYPPQQPYPQQYPPQQAYPPQGYASYPPPRHQAPPGGMRY